MLKAKDVIALVKACGAAGVTELSLGELSVRFSSTTPPREEISATNPVAAIPTEQQEAFALSAERLGVELDEQKLKEERMDLMLIENPTKYEELLMAGDLEDGEAARH